MYPQAKIKLTSLPAATAVVKVLEAVLKVLLKNNFDHVSGSGRGTETSVALNGDYLLVFQV